MDHSLSLDSPYIIRCTLNGKNCLVFIKTGMNILSSIILKSDSSFNRVVYSTSTGIWSKNVADKKKLNNKILSTIFQDSLNENNLKNNDLLFEDDLQHLLIFNNNSNISDVIPIDKSLLIVVTTNSSISR